MTDLEDPHAEFARRLSRRLLIFSGLVIFFVVLLAILGGF